MNEPAFGDRVLVRPTSPQRRVQRRAETFGQFLSNDWEECLWDEWMHRRLCEGAIEWKAIVIVSSDDQEEPSTHSGQE